MSEQRLIDIDALKEKGQYVPCGNGLLFHGVTAATIDAMHTIDPETIPIVRELRETLQEAFTFDKICANCKHLEYQDFYAVCGKGILGIVHPSDYCSRFVKAEKPVKKFCVNCKFWDDFNGVCFNHDSIHDGAYEVRACEKYEKKEGRENAPD